MRDGLMRLDAAQDRDQGQRGGPGGHGGVVVKTGNFLPGSGDESVVSLA
jgi:hypothetical protein